MKWRAFLVAMSALLIAVLAAGATFALFSAQSAPVSHTLTAGTLTVDLKDDAGNILSAPIMVAQDLAPGDSLEYFTNVANTGSLPLRYTISFERTGSPGAESDALAQWLVMTVERENGAGWALVGTRSLKDWTSGGLTDQPGLEAGASARYRLSLHLPLETPNGAQTGQVAIKLLVNAIQAQNLPGGSWSMSGPGTATVNASPGGLTASYRHSIPGWSYDFQTWTWQTQSTATKSGTLTFDWHYWGFNAWFNSYAGLEAFAVQPDGSEQVVTLQPWGYAGPGFSWTGSGSLNIHQGKPWGYRMKAYHYDGTRVWNGDLEVITTGFTPAP